MTASFDLRLGECIAGMAAMPDMSVDVAISDPPYSEWVHSKHRVAQKQDNDLPNYTAPSDGKLKRRICQSKQIGFEHITQAEMEAASDQFARTTRRWTLVFCDVESSHLWAGALRRAGLEHIRTLAWQKLGGTPQFTGDRPSVAFEAIVLAHRPGRKTWNGGGKAGWYAIPTAMDRDGSGLDVRLHTTQKPVALLEDLVRDFTDPGELILDAYAGSGTTGVACARLGRRFVGFERDPAMHAIATKRLAGELTLPSAFHHDRQGSLLP